MRTIKNWRFGLIVGSLTLLYLGLGARMYELQLRGGSFFFPKAAASLAEDSVEAENRGVIFATDRAGNKITIALGKKFSVAFAVPSEIEDPTVAAEAVAEIFSLDPATLENSFSKINDPYELIEKKITKDQAAALNKLDMRGLYVAEETFRFYPFQNFAAHLLGFVGPRDFGGGFEGRYGIEQKFENELKKGSSIQLTIDREIQSQVDQVLVRLIDRFKAAGGTVIVQEPRTGKILALSNYPTFNPNVYAEAPVSAFLNPAVQSVYEPGSVFKVLTIAGGLDSGKLTPETTYNDSGELNLNGYTIRNWDLKAYGKTTIREVIEQSINTGAAFAATKTGYDVFRDYLMKFGFEDPTGVDLPGEVAGNLRNLSSGAREINFATASFGQGVAVTPLQLINAVSAIANQGVLMRPFVISDSSPEVIRRVISVEAAKTTTDLMRGAVEKAKVATIPDYNVAGKTGTAQIPNPRGGGYLEEFIHTYVGFAPTTDPRFTILLKLDRPQGAPVAGLTVVPAFKELTEFILNYYNIPPDRLSKDSK